MKPMKLVILRHGNVSVAQCDWCWRLVSCRWRGCGHLAWLRCGFVGLTLAWRWLDDVGLECGFGLVLVCWLECLLGGDVDVGVA